MISKKLVSILVILMVVAFVVPQITFASWWNPFSWNWNSMFHRQNINKNPNIVGNDKDSHGCIGSAGYTWCAVKNKCLRTWEEKCETNQTISDTTIISAINKTWKVQLIKNTNGTYSTAHSGGQGAQYYSVDLIAKGDLNNDGFQDAIIKGSGCGASCGSIFTVVINKNNNSANAFNVEPEGILTSSAAQSSINSITVNNGIITINATLYHLDGRPTSNLNYKLAGNNLVKTSAEADQTADWKTYTNTWGGFEIKYPSNWKITDGSIINNSTDVVTLSINIESPLRSDLPGYQGIPVSYRILIYKPGTEVASIADFGSNQKPTQSWWNLSISETAKEATPEYKIGQQIISSFKFTAEQAIEQGQNFSFDIVNKNIDIRYRNTGELLQKIPLTRDVLGWNSNPQVKDVILSNDDINFDGYKDLAVLMSVPADNPGFYDYFIYNPSTKKFVADKVLVSLCGPIFNATTKTIKTEMSEGCVGQNFEKQTFSFTNGNYMLTQIKDGDCCSFSSNGGTLSVTVKNFANGTLLTTTQESCPPQQ